MRKILPLFALLALTASVDASPEHVAAHADALAGARARYPLMPQLRMDVARAVLQTLNPIRILSFLSVSSPMISELTTDAGYQNAFGGDAGATPFYCVQFLSPLFLSDGKFVLKVDVLDAGPGVLNMTARFGTNAQRRCFSVKTVSPSPELAALNNRA